MFSKKKSLFRATKKGDLKNVEKNLNKGVNVNIKDKWGNTLLHWVESLDIAELIISKGLDINIKNNNGETPLHRVYNLKVAELLIEKGANVNAKDNWNNTPLHNATDSEIIDLLIEKGANVKAKNSLGEKPLKWISDDIKISENRLTEYKTVSPENKVCLKCGGSTEDKGRIEFCCMMGEAKYNTSVKESSYTNKKVEHTESSRELGREIGCVCSICAQQYSNSIALTDKIGKWGMLISLVGGAILGIIILISGFFEIIKPVNSSLIGVLIIISGVVFVISLIVFVRNATPEGNYSELLPQSRANRYSVPKGYILVYKNGRRNAKGWSFQSGWNAVSVIDSVLKKPTGI